VTEWVPLSLFASMLTLWAFTLSAVEVDEPEPVYFSAEEYAPIESLPVQQMLPRMLADFEWEESRQYELIWDMLADCESGDRDRNGDVIKGTARWWYGDPNYRHPSWGLTLFHGGLQFLPATWNWVAPMVLENPPDFAWQATQFEQVRVAIRTQELQGWEAWPNCSKKIGLLSN